MKLVLSNLLYLTRSCNFINKSIVQFQKMTIKLFESFLGNVWDLRGGTFGNTHNTENNSNLLKNLL